MNERTYNDAIERLRRIHGETLEVPVTNEGQRKWFGYPRVEITTTYESGAQEVNRGRISITTGWKPALILMSRRDSWGSSHTLDPVADIVTAWIGMRGRRYPL